MSEKKELWVVKDKDGQIKGPYNTHKLLELIELGEFSGEEKISSYPSLQWHSFSQNALFYDKLLDVLKKSFNQTAEEPEASSYFASQEDSASNLNPSPIEPSTKSENEKSKKSKPDTKSHLPSSSQIQKPEVRPSSLKKPDLQKKDPHVKKIKKIHKITFKKRSSKTN